MVRHVSGGSSTLLFKAYEQGRGKWQANTVDYVWFDEEPPEDVYFEGITRTNATGGSIAVTFTPLKGMSAVVARYLLEVSEDRAVITMTIEDALGNTGASTTARLVSAGGAGGGTGLVQGFGAGEGGARERGKQAATEMAIGTGTGVAMLQIAAGANKAVSALTRKTLGESNDAATVLLMPTSASPFRGRCVQLYSANYPPLPCPPRRASF
jgi:phage terminase large subunit-like protein